MTLPESIAAQKKARYEILVFEAQRTWLIYDSQFGPIGGPNDPSNVLCTCTTLEYAKEICDSLNTTQPTKRIVA